MKGILPAHAGVILITTDNVIGYVDTSRTRGGVILHMDRIQRSKHIQRKMHSNGSAFFLGRLPIRKNMAKTDGIRKKTLKI